MNVLISLKTKVMFMSILNKCILLIIGFLSSALILRHDVPDINYINLAKAYKQLCHLPDGEGTLISSQWVLTAAHAAARIKEGLEFESQLLICNDREYEVEAVILHPDFKMSPTSIKNDIALIKLKENVIGVEPASLYSRKDEQGKIITVVGRGDTGTGLTGPVKMDKITRAGTNIIDGADGEWIYFKFDHPDSPNSTELEAISGPGDSGGPAFFDNGNTRYIVGVSSYQIGEGRGAGVYGVIEYYTRISEFSNWIEQTISNYKPVVKTETVDEVSELDIFAGTYEGNRVIRISKNTVRYKRGNGPFLTLRLKGEYLFEFVLPPDVVSANPLPDLKFIFDANGVVTGFTLIHEDRTEEVRKLRE